MDPKGHTICIGDYVETLLKRRPTCTGFVVTVSDCGRYVKVQKTYGMNQCWREDWRVEDVRVIFFDTNARNRVRMIS